MTSYLIFWMISILLVIDCQFNDVKKINMFVHLARLEQSRDIPRVQPQIHQMLSLLANKICWDYFLFLVRFVECWICGINLLLIKLKNLIMRWSFIVTKFLLLSLDKVSLIINWKCNVFIDYSSFNENTSIY